VKIVWKLSIISNEASQPARYAHISKLTPFFVRPFLQPQREKATPPWQICQLEMPKH
jgi:hypothetical protein